MTVATRFPGDVVPTDGREPSGACRFGKDPQSGQGESHGVESSATKSMHLVRCPAWLPLET
jgi:hypothetical protein